MTALDKVVRMPGRTLLYGFLAFVTIASVVTMLNDPLNPEIGNTSSNPADWSPQALKDYCREV